MTSWLNQTVKMNNIKKDSTEEKILNAAHSIFIQKGMDGSRMQEIADKAKINKALLHYYFRTKQKLFEAIFKKVFSQIFPNIKELIQSELPIEEKLSIFVEKYINLLQKNPFLPSFILKEVNRDPDFIASGIKDQGINPSEIFIMFEKEMKNGKIRKMDPRDLFINILGMCIFPLAAKPLLKIMFFENSKKTYDDFITKRKITVKEFILNSILLK